MKNVIPQRVAEFLGQYPPFSHLEKPELYRLAGQVLVQYRPAGAVIFSEGDDPMPLVYIVRQGAVELFEEKESKRILIDRCDEGDVFGLRPLLARQPYALTAEVREETLLYAIPFDDIGEWLRRHPALAGYLAADFAAGYARNFGRSNRADFRSEAQNTETLALTEVLHTRHRREPVTCDPGETVRTAAQRMTDQHVGSIIIVDADHRPLGIVTDKDLRRQVATGRVPLDAQVGRIMSSPVITVTPEPTVADLQIRMLRHRIGHVVSTADGTTGSPVLGVFSEHDLLVIQGNNPALLVRDIQRTDSTAGLRAIREQAEGLLRKYLEQEVAISFIASVLSTINDGIIRRCIALSEAELPVPPPVDYAWLSLGSEGRQEQLLRTDQDNALLFDEVAEVDLPRVRKLFIDLARRVNDRLHEVGFVYCPAKMMAGNPSWCLSLGEWKNQFGSWILQPTPQAVRYSTIFFDYRVVHGQSQLAKVLTDHIFSLLEEQTAFFSFLAKDALENPPPLTFFRNFVVEKSGDHAEAFDLKARAMMPLTDAARVLILHALEGGINNTFRRFERLAELEPRNASLYEQAADAYEILMRYRARAGLANGDGGRYLRPESLSKMERLHLRNSFRPIRELQSLIHTRFQLAYFLR